MTTFTTNNSESETKHGEAAHPADGTNHEYCSACDCCELCGCCDCEETLRELVETRALLWFQHGVEAEKGFSLFRKEFGDTLPGSNEMKAVVEAGMAETIQELLWKEQEEQEEQEWVGENRRQQAKFWFQRGIEAEKFINP
jgi:hypothetical protein